MPDPSQTRYWVSRLLLCLATAVIISATAYLCAWCSYRNAIYHGSEAYLTRMTLEALRKEIEAHRVATGAWPARLTDLKTVQLKQVRVDDAGSPVDSWGRPLHYRIEAGGYELFSYGRDGKPGGVGTDADQYAGQPDTATDRPTLWQFTTREDARPAQIASLIAGVVAFPICLLQAREKGGKRPSLVKVLLGSAVTAVFAIIAALMISTLHVMPGGH